MRNLWQAIIHTTTLAVFLASPTWTAASAASVQPGESGGEYVILGESTDNVSIEIAPLGARFLVLNRGTTVTANDTIVIKANVDWKLTVEDTSAGFANAKGFMEPYVSDAYVDEENDELTNGFAVLVEGIGDNDGILKDAKDLSLGPVEIAKGNSTGGLEKAVYLMYSQELSGNEIAGDYRIDLSYTLSINI